MSDFVKAAASLKKYRSILNEVLLQTTSSMVLFYVNEGRTTRNCRKNEDRRVPLKGVGERKQREERDSAEFCTEMKIYE